ncbi:hypothetical protein H6P81_003932 [Aristolochia fimbriata]|uniref:Pectinesterase inhibitor domain-containing protein n=1 Tax=Aristolochia fimbriata TaxID=158543 RepID=A0AAV7FFU3_ARIFI|nr:hypothetical protein H6P81_003932 [Aristolochia fimbriata]
MFQQSQRKATDTYAMIRLLLNNPNLEDALRAPLGYALENYPSGIIKSLQQSLQAIDANHYDTAASLGSACASTADDCEDQFRARNLTSPIKQQDELQAKLCITGVGLVSQLH